MLKYLFTSLFLLFIVSSKAQVTTTTSDSTKVLYLVVKTDNTEYYGYVLSDDGREILLETKSIGKLYIQKSDIKEMKKVSSDKLGNPEGSEYGDFRSTGPFTTRYYFTTNALPIKKHENYALIHLYGPEAHFAVSNNLSIGVMTTWIASPLAMALKYSFNADPESKVHFALGSIVGTSGYIAQGSLFGGLHFGTVTYGDRSTNFSLSAGYGYVGTGAQNRIGFGYLGPKHLIPYQGSYQKDAALWESLENTSYGNHESVYDNFKDATFLGLSGITPVGNTSSFIFDAMFVLSAQDGVSYEDQQHTYMYDDGNGPQIETTTIQVASETKTIGYMKTLILMPSVRLSRKHGHSFQIALAGFINANANNNIISAPLPMVSWLREF